VGVEEVKGMRHQSSLSQKKTGIRRKGDRHKKEKRWKLTIQNKNWSTHNQINRKGQREEDKKGGVTEGEVRTHKHG